MKLKLAILAIAVAMTLPAQAAEYEIKGMGAKTCGWINESFAVETEQGKAQIFVGIISWMQGYMSGKNLELPVPYRRNLDPAGIEKMATSIDTFCAGKPNLMLYQVADQIFQTMPYMSSNGV